MSLAISFGAASGAASGVYALQSGQVGLSLELLLAVGINLTIVAVAFGGMVAEVRSLRREMRELRDDQKLAISDKDIQRIASPIHTRLDLQDREITRLHDRVHETFSRESTRRLDVDREDLLRRRAPGFSSRGDAPTDPRGEGGTS